MKYTIVLCLVSASLFLSHLSQGQTGTERFTQRQEPGALDGFSPTLLSKVRALALIVQQKMADGEITGATLQQELQGGDASAAIRGLGPDANRLFEEIQASLQANYSEESLAVLLQALTGAVP